MLNHRKPDRVQRIELIEIGPVEHREVDADGKLLIPHPSKILGSWRDSGGRASIALCTFFALILDVAHKDPDPMVGRQYRFHRSDRYYPSSLGSGPESGWGLYANIPFDWRWIASHARFDDGAEAFLLHDPSDSAWPHAIGPGLASKRAGATRPDAFDAIVSGHDPNDPEWRSVGFVQGSAWSGTLPDRIQRIRERLAKRRAAEERRARARGTFSGPWR